MQVRTPAEIKFKIKTVTKPHDDMQDSWGRTQFVKHLFCKLYSGTMFCEVKDYSIWSLEIVNCHKLSNCLKSVEFFKPFFVMWKRQSNLAKKIKKHWQNNVVWNNFFVNSIVQTAQKDVMSMCINCLDKDLR